MNARPVVAVIGAGASGTLATIALARRASASDQRFDLVLVDPDPPGRGVAYATTDPRHRLNVPAGNMSALLDEPGDFVTWLRAHRDPDAGPGDYAARQDYGSYLAEVLAESLAASAGIRLHQERTRATDLRRQGRRWRIRFADGTSRPADAVLLALGPGEPALDWAPPTLRRSPRFVADAWGGETDLPNSGAVVLVGAGLTMADLALRCPPQVQVHAVSRHGLLPLAHREQPTPAVPLPEVPSEPVSLSALRRLVFAHLRSVVADTGDWRAAIDGLRPDTSALWQRLADADREAFWSTAARRWNRARHRVAPQIAETLDRRQADGSLHAHQAVVVDVADRADALRVQLSDGTTVDAQLLINCTGPANDPRRSADALLMHLLEGGLARPGRLGLGLDVDAAGRVLGQSSAAAGAGLDSPTLWAIGPLRQGDLWESTAIPEIRAQAAALATDLLAALPAPGLRRRPRDPYGLPLTADPAAAQAYVEGLGRILRVQSGAEWFLAAAVGTDPGFALGHATRALLGVEWGADVDVPAALAAAHRTADRADEREQRYIEAVTARVQAPGPESSATLIAYLHAYPEDALAASIAVPTIAFGGATDVPAEAWAIVEGLAPAYGDDWWYQSLLAFIRQEQERYAEAAELAERALATEPGSGHAVHARTHVYYETGDHVAGLAWLDDWIRNCGRAASHRAHFSWHAALHELALGDDQAAARRYAAQLAPPGVRGVRALVDSASLLWRGQAMGIWPAAGVDQVLENVPAELLSEPATPFVALHAAMAMVAVGDCQGLCRLRRYAAARPEPAFADTVAPLADALAQLTHGDADRATDALLELSGVAGLGGSAAQREIVEETLLYSAVRAGRVDVARRILTERLDRRASPSDGRRLRELSSPSPLG